jgi:hypothetical protein
MAEPDVEAVAAGHSSAIVAHVERHLGPVRQVYADTLATARGLEPIDVLHVAPSDERRYHTLITHGMSARAMNVPAGSDAPRYLELVATLPKSWSMPPAAVEDDASFWPVRQLQRLARWPDETQSWLGWGQAVPNGDPPQPFSAETKLCGAIIVPSLMVPRKFYELVTNDRAVTFFSMVPLYKEELDLRAQIGMERFLERLIDYEVDDLIHPRRRNVARGRMMEWFRK